jgi:pimeloyl-ACP methyl ester carboxylesterase
METTGEIVARLMRDGTGIHREVHGLGSTILLTHGFGATCRMWDEQIEEFTDRHRLILWDLPGHGESEAPARCEAPRQALSQAALVKDMLAILDSEDAGRAVLIGLGIGGTLSLRFWRANPRRVRGLVLLGTMPGLRSARSGMARSASSRRPWTATGSTRWKAVPRSILACIPIREHSPTRRAHC